MLTWGETLLANLEGKISESDDRYMNKEQAKAHLKKMSGEDFGDNSQKWKKMDGRQYK